MSVDQLDTLDDLRQELDRIDTNTNATIKQISGLKDRMNDFDDRLSTLEDEVTLTKASVPEQSRGKIENVMDVITHAYERQTGGRAGVKLPSGEVTAAIDGSKQTALRLMDEIAGKFPWATVENPGGPKQKALKLKTDAPVDARKDAVAEHYS